MRRGRPSCRESFAAKSTCFLSVLGVLLSWPCYSSQITSSSSRNGATVPGRSKIPPRAFTGMMARASWRVQRKSTGRLTSGAAAAVSGHLPRGARQLSKAREVTPRFRRRPCRHLNPSLRITLTKIPWARFGACRSLFGTAWRTSAGTGVPFRPAGCVHSRRSSARSRGQFPGRGDALQARGDSATAGIPRRRKGHGAVATRKQPDPRLVLQVRDEAADGGLPERGPEGAQGVGLWQEASRSG